MKMLYRRMKCLMHELFNWHKSHVIAHGAFCSWMTEFISNKVNPDKLNRNHVACFSVYGRPEMIRWSLCKYKVFFTAENTHAGAYQWDRFDNIYLKEKSLSLYLGFDYMEHEKYIRFPFWLTWCFKPTATKEDIRAFVHKYNYADVDGRDRFCPFICHSDYFGNRATMADLIETVAPLCYPSTFRHNDDTLKEDYDDDKIAYLRRFKFILCPENTNNRGYITEKIFDAVKGGCVPIYWGNEGFPETDILNKDAIIYLDIDNPQPALDKIRYLNDNPKAYREFASQPRFVEGAEDVIYECFERLEKKLTNIIEE